MLLGAIDHTGNIREPVIYTGLVKKGKTIPSGRNHADYIDGKG